MDQISKLSVKEYECIRNNSRLSQIDLSSEAFEVAVLNYNK